MEKSIRLFSLFSADKMYSITVNGVTERHYYVSTSATEYSVPVTQGEMTNLPLAFETATQSDFKLEYKGTEIASI